MWPFPLLRQHCPNTHCNPCPLVVHGTQNPFKLLKQPCMTMGQAHNAPGTALKAREHHNPSRKFNGIRIVHIGFLPREPDIFIGRCGFVHSSPLANTLCVRKLNIWLGIAHRIIPSFERRVMMINCKAL